VSRVPIDAALQFNARDDGHHHRIIKHGDGACDRRIPVAKVDRHITVDEKGHV